LKVYTTLERLTVDVCAALSFHNAQNTFVVHIYRSECKSSDLDRHVKAVRKDRTWVGTSPASFVPTIASNGLPCRVRQLRGNRSSCEPPLSPLSRFCASIVSSKANSRLTPGQVRNSRWTIAYISPRSMAMFFPTFNQ
jgi:hypothetical protein